MPIRRPVAVLFLSFAGSSGAAAETPDCTAIAEATIAEMRAGALSWGEAEEALVRRAAGAACVKARVRASQAPGAAVVPSVGAGAGNPASSNDAESGSWPAGLKRNEISGSPNKKPYQRKRD